MWKRMTTAAVLLPDPWVDRGIHLLGMKRATRMRYQHNAQHGKWVVNNDEGTRSFTTREAPPQAPRLDRPRLLAAPGAALSACRSVTAPTLLCAVALLHGRVSSLRVCFTATSQRDLH